MVLYVSATEKFQEKDPENKFLRSNQKFIVYQKPVLPVKLILPV
jgi:hypothetical protein